MTYQVRRLVEGNSPVVCVKVDESLSNVVELMLENDFSQIPVVVTRDNYLEPVGIITTDDVLRAMDEFRSPLNRLIADNAMQSPITISIEDDLFELFDAVSYKGSILVTGFAGELVSIITSSDVMDFFKQQTIDSLYLEDIEKSIKDLVLYGFSDETESFCQEKLDDAIEEIHASEGSIKAKFEKAIRTYLGICDLPSKKINEEALNTSFFRLDIAKRKISFDELSLNEYIQLLTSSNRWDFYKDIFHASREAVRKRLEGIRDIRNQLAHYRGEITANQQKQLKRTSEWLNRCLIKFEETKTEIIDSSEFIEDQVIDEENSSEIKNSARSIYSPLAVYLNNLTYIDRIKLSFQEIEDILGFKLPKSAYTYRAWWANDNKTHSHSKEWLSAGWKVAYSNISNQEIDFKKIQGGGRKI